MDVKGKSAFEVSSSIQGPNETFVTIKVVIYLQLCDFGKLEISSLMSSLLLPYDVLLSE